MPNGIEAIAPSGGRKRRVSRAELPLVGAVACVALAASVVVYLHASSAEAAVRQWCDGQQMKYAHAGRGLGHCMDGAGRMYRPPS